VEKLHHRKKGKKIKKFNCCWFFGETVVADHHHVTHSEQPRKAKSWSVTPPSAIGLNGLTASSYQTPISKRIVKENRGLGPRPRRVEFS
jgi:hypothetical protein